MPPISSERHVTPPAITAGDRAFVRVAVATGWRRPDAPRRVDVPALEAPPRLREWLASMTVREAAGLLGIADTQVLLGEPVSVLAMHGGWAWVASHSSRLRSTRAATRSGSPSPS